MISDLEFENYIQSISPAIRKELSRIKNTQTTKQTDDMLMSRFTEEEMQIYQEIHSSSMKHGNIWEI